MGDWIYIAGGEWSASCPGRFTPGERAPGTHWIGGWVDPRAGLDDIEKRNFLTLPELELRPFSRPARSQLVYRLLYPASRGGYIWELKWLSNCHFKKSWNSNHFQNAFMIMRWRIMFLQSSQWIADHILITTELDHLLIKLHHSVYVNT
jgi:hypothetical protein